jgi:plasmid replication initiation protein
LGRDKKENLAVMSKVKSNKGIKLVTKSNNLIEARYKFDIWETRIFTTVLSQINKDDVDFHIYRIYMKDVIKEFGINNGNAYDLLRDAANNLMNKKFFLDYEGDGAERMKVYHIIRSVDYMTEVKDETKRHLHEYVDVSIDPDMKPMLLHLKKQFTTYDVRNIVRFKSSYTVRIYEHLKQYESIGNRKMEIDYLKRVFEINDEYPLFANFYQKVIEPAFKDINLHTDIFITEIDKVKEGKKVVALHFHFRKNTLPYTKKLVKGRSADAELPFPPMDAETPLVMEVQTSTDALFVKYQEKVVGSFGVTPTVFLIELVDKTDEQIAKAIRVTDLARTQGDLKSVPGFFIQALRNGYTNDKEEKMSKLEKVEQTRKLNAIRQKEILSLRNQLEFLHDEHAQLINTRIRELTSQDSTVTQQAIDVLNSRSECMDYIQKLELSLERDLDIDDYRKDSTLRDWVKEQIVELNRDVFADDLTVFDKSIADLEAKIRMFK